MTQIKQIKQIYTDSFFCTSNAVMEFHADSSDDTDFSVSSDDTDFSTSTIS